MVFKNNRKFNIALAAGITILFWSVYFIWVQQMPEGAPDKTILTYFTVGLGSVSAIMLVHFLTSYETLTIRKPLNSITYDYQSLTGALGWKRHIDDFDELLVYTTTKTDSGGQYSGDSHWVFELVKQDEGLKVPVFQNIVHIPAKNREKALMFAQKISDFTGIVTNVK